MTRRSRAVLLALLGALVTAAPARADSATISFTDAWGKEDPVAGVVRHWVVTGTSAGESRVYVKYRRPGAPCASTALNDPGDARLVFLLKAFWDDEVGPGPFRLSGDYEWNAPGTYQICTWVARTADTPVVPTQQVITFRAPTATIAASISPESPVVGSAATITFTGVSEAAYELQATIRPAGAGSCASEANPDVGEQLLEKADVLGTFQVSVATKPLEETAYDVCVWLDDWWHGSAADMPRMFRFTVTDPTPKAPETQLTASPKTRCIVPAATVGMTLSGAQQRLRKAHCATGKSRRARGRVRAGRVLRFTRAKGTSLSSGTKVGIVVSTGPSRPASPGGEFRAATAALPAPLQPLNRNVVAQRFQLE